MAQKLFTKSAFKYASACPRQVYYYRNPQLYANSKLDDEFLASLAEGGFQVGEAAKVYFQIPEENDIKTLDYDQSVAKTQALFSQARVKIAEAAFRFGKCFVRTDILIREGHNVKLIEVKSHSWDSKEKSFTQKRNKLALDSDIREYIEDVAFQKWVVVNALKEQYPGEQFNVTAFLMMPDKAKKAPVSGINQMFKIVEVGGRKRAVRLPEAEKLVGTDPIVVPFPVDNYCSWIIEGIGVSEEISVNQEIMESFTLDDTDLSEDIILSSQVAISTDKKAKEPFEIFVNRCAEAYYNNEPLFDGLSMECFTCPFHRSPGDPAELRDGVNECRKIALGWTDEEFQKPLITNLNGRKDGYFNKKIWFLEDIPVPDNYKVDDTKGISHEDRNMLITGMLTGREELLLHFRHNIHGDAYLNIPYLREKMDSWVFPLHMIDFETSGVALPFYENMRPYESVAFQFSHHIIHKTESGYTIEHAGQFINVEKGKFPNFDFLRALKADLEQGNGTIFRYSHHENTILNAIAKQLYESSQPDKSELIEFIYSITHDDKKKRKGGPRDMVDLCDLVKKSYYHPSMKGSNSIKVVLPAVLNTSEFIKEKYSKPIYGSEVKSLTIPADKPISWITYEDDGVTVKNPYKLLPPVSEYLGMDEATMEAIDEAASKNIANGGSALTAYSELQFSDGIKSEALSKALLRYCELDTMAMVFIWEYFYHEVYYH
mgnify:CR=1 FL=1